jgi:hypothetical protein
MAEKYILAFAKLKIAIKLMKIQFNQIEPENISLAFCVTS